MSYNISTMFIWQYFNNECECPTCRLRQKTESDCADTYLSEAVMEDAERMRVNKYGFCKDHYDLLYSGRNKLGVALQISTRIKTLNRYLNQPKDAKSAKKLAETLKAETCDCVICRKIEFNMKRYYETVCKLYGDDEKFREKSFKSVNGFCFPCYIRLLENVGKAGKYAPELIANLHEKMQNSVNSLDKAITEFTMAFDYHSSGLPSEKASSSLRRARIKLYGEKPLPPERK